MLQTTLKFFHDTTFPSFFQLKRLQNVIIFTAGAFARAAGAQFLTDPAITAIVERINDGGVNVLIFSAIFCEGVHNPTTLCTKIARLVTWIRFQWRASPHPTQSSSIRRSLTIRNVRFVRWRRMTI
ncbi:hypothetical protein Mapa_009261 [Marchantia paleacea]|nr:hypothetical protein Mapa_009261 [Marchantia paleacea]